MSEQHVAILILGGGIGGLATALALAKKGRRVHVIEKASEFREIGAGLQLAPNASRVLDRLGVLRALHEHAVFPSRLVWMDAISGKPITALDLGKRFQDAYGYPYMVMHRSDLLDTLLAACRASERVTLETSRELVAIEQEATGVRAICRDGSVYLCDALIAADGLWSTVRPFLSDTTEPREPICARYVAYRGTIPMPEIAECVGHDAVVMWTGSEMHLVQYPIRRGELYNQVAVFKSHRYRPDSDDWGTVGELDERFAGACADVRTALTLIKRDRRWPLFDREPIAKWTRGRIGLLGDAAHPMLQYLAQGAAQALEDATCLADEMTREGATVPDALVSYQNARLLRTARVQLTARFFGEFIHVGGVGLAVRNELLAKRPHDDLSPVDWLYRANEGS